ncbi:MAG: hypothetical protein ACRDIL_13755 [Candidatus Limnocylindrales bacterium]
MYRIRRFGIIKTATVAAVMYMVIIAIFAIPFALIVAVAGSRVPVGGTTIGFDAGGVIAIALLAIVFYGILGWIVTAIACALYNLVAGWIGGVEVELETVAPPPPPAVWGQSAPPAAPPRSEPPSTPPYSS